jgi:hypothetical protein
MIPMIGAGVSAIYRRFDRREVKRERATLVRRDSRGQGLNSRASRES